jgi:hypothetical protein
VVTIIKCNNGRPFRGEALINRGSVKYPVLVVRALGRSLDRRLLHGWLNVVDRFAAVLLTDQLRRVLVVDVLSNPELSRTVSVELSLLLRRTVPSQRRSWFSLGTETANVCRTKLQRTRSPTTLVHLGCASRIIIKVENVPTFSATSTVDSGI